MKSSKQEISINHNAEDLYNIVLDVEKYPDFIPWCNSLIIKSQLKNQITADMIVSYKNILPQKFTSKVNYNKNNLTINTSYINGPLKDLETNWTFKSLKTKKTLILFTIKFEFKNFIHQKIAEFFFILIKNEMINSFKKRANEILN